jgi:hypothetical protein
VGGGVGAGATAAITPAAQEEIASTRVKMSGSVVSQLFNTSVLMPTSVGVPVSPRKSLATSGPPLSPKQMLVSK